MSREEVIRLSYAQLRGGMSKDDMSVLLMQYCMELGKSYDASATFVLNILLIPQFLAYCVKYALEYYQRKFSICELYSAPNPDELGNGRRIILIY